MFEYFYHEIIRRTIIGFGTLFDNIKIKKFDEEGNSTSVIKVPLAYGPTQKFLARLEQEPNLNKPIQITLPRMSFELAGINYDPTRKGATTQSFITTSQEDKTEIKKAYMPVPYNLEFELSIFCKLNDDMLQIIEQILPYFQPAYTLTITLVNTIQEKRDIPIVYQGMEMRDEYEGNYDTRRSLIYTLRFVAKTYLFGPVTSVSDGDIIKKSSIGFVSGDSKSTTRDLRYTVEPTATKSYSESVIGKLLENINSDNNKIKIDGINSISKNSVIQIDEESMLVTNIVGDYVFIERGYYETDISSHVLGSAVKIITQSDNDLIEAGDDFGFSGLQFN